MQETEGKPALKTVCGSEMQDPGSYPRSRYRGEVVYFCTRACLRAFELDPDRFIAGEIEHPEKED